MKIKIVKNEIPFFISYIICLSLFVLSTTFYGQYIMGVIRSAALLFCIGMLYIQELQYIVMPQKDVLGLIVCLLLVVVMYRVAGTVTALEIIFIFSSRNIDFEKIAKITIVLSSVLLLFVVISAYLKIIPNYQVSGERNREYLGFLYALYSPGYMQNITILYLYIKKEKITVLQCIFLIGINFWFFLKTRSRLSFAVSILLIIMGLIYKYMSHIIDIVLQTKIVSVLMVGSFVFSAAISFFITIIYTSSNAWMYKLNDFMENRIALGKISLFKHGISLFGKKIHWVGNGLSMYGKASRGRYSWVDCFYIQVLQQYGVIFFGIVLFLVTLALYKLYKRKEYYLMLLICTIALRCIMDDQSIHLFYNTFLILIGKVLMDSVFDLGISSESSSS